MMKIERRGMARVLSQERRIIPPLTSIKISLHTCCIPSPALCNIFRQNLAEVEIYAREVSNKYVFQPSGKFDLTVKYSLYLTQSRDHRSSERLPED